MVISPSASPIKTVMSLVMKRTQENLLDLTKARAGLECVIAQVPRRKLPSPNSITWRKHHLDGNKWKRPRLLCRKDAEFHDIILKSTKSIVSKIMLSSVTPLVAESIKMTWANGGIERANKMHREIFKALQKTRSGLAGQKWRSICNTAEEIYKRYYKDLLSV